MRVCCAQYDLAHVKRLSQRLVQGIMSRVKHVVLNGHAERRYPGCVNMSFSYIEGESILMGLKEVALSSGRCVSIHTGTCALLDFRFNTKYCTLVSSTRIIAFTILQV